MKDKTHELKSLQTRKKKLEGQFDALSVDYQDLGKELDGLYTKIEAIEQKIRELSRPDKEIIVSEHAILRYLERVYELNLDDLKNEILAPIHRMAKKMGNGKFPLGNGYRAIVKNGVVVTISK